MDKNNTRCAASLRRSAVVERLCLREEWSALKETTDETATHWKQSNTRAKKQQNVMAPHTNTYSKKNFKGSEETKQVSNVLRGVVVLVEVGSGSSALALRAVLSALGASVLPTWSQLVTHLVWTEGGCRSIRAKAKTSACQLVSPLWVESCAAQRRKLPERMFPVPTRSSDLPSPATLHRFLKRTDQENIPIQNLLNSQESDTVRPTRLRLSSETEHDTANNTDASRDKSKHTSLESNVKTSKRKFAEPSTLRKPKKSKRKLFTQKEAQILTDEEHDTTAAGPKKMQPTRITQRDKKGLAKAERMARLLIGTSPLKGTQTIKSTHGTLHKNPPRIILTGMSRKERYGAWHAIRQLNGIVQRHVDRRTTHVIMGSCYGPATKSPESAKSTRSLSMCNRCCSPGTILSQMVLTNVTVDNNSKGNKNNGRHIVCSCNNDDISGINELQKSSASDAFRNDKPRTVNALLGAARGCRVLGYGWVKDSLKANRWVQHIGYEVRHLKKISQRARVERSALEKMQSEYAYDVFKGTHIKISADAEQKDAIIQLLTICGAVVQNGGDTLQQNGRRFRGKTVNQMQNVKSITADVDMTIGRGNGEVNSKWVFDSITAARMRTTRRYINRC